MTKVDGVINSTGSSFMAPLSSKCCINDLEPSRGEERCQDDTVSKERGGLSERGKGGWYKDSAGGRILMNCPTIFINRFCPRRRRKLQHGRYELKFDVVLVFC